MSSVYQINRGVNRPIVFKGLKAQWIWWLGIGLLLLLLLFALLYIIGVSVFVCVAMIFFLGGLLFWYVHTMSHRYGEYGLMKKMAGKSVPRWIRCNRLIQ